MPPFPRLPSDPGNITDSSGALARNSSLSLTVWLPWQYPGGEELPWHPHSSCSALTLAVAHASNGLGVV
eukprot:12798837-Prorocentrum_lima.AAC.1